MDYNPVSSVRRELIEIDSDIKRLSQQLNVCQNSIENKEQRKQELIETLQRTGHDIEFTDAAKLKEEINKIRISSGNYKSETSSRFSNLNRYISQIDDRLCKLEEDKENEEDDFDSGDDDSERIDKLEEELERIDKLEEEFKKITTSLNKKIDKTQEDLNIINKILSSALVNRMTDIDMLKDRLSKLENHLSSNNISHNSRNESD